MSKNNHRGPFNAFGGGARVAEQNAPVTPNSLCPLPLIGWKPSRIASADGLGEAPPLVRCLGQPCGFFVTLRADGSGCCGVAALSAVIGNVLPAALVAALANAQANGADATAAAEADMNAAHAPAQDDASAPASEAEAQSA